MAWASERCKPHAFAPLRPESQRSAPHRPAPRRTPPRGLRAPPNPPLSSVDWWADVHHRPSAPHRVAPPCSAPHVTEAPVQPGRPHHLLQAHEPSG